MTGIKFLLKKFCRMDLGEGISSSFALNLENRGINDKKNSNRGCSRSKSRNDKDNEKYRKKLEYWNSSKTGHLKKNCRSPKKEDNKNKANAVIEEVQDALLLSIDNSIYSWVLDSGALFHTTAYRDLLENYVADNYGNVFLVDGKPFEIVGMGDVRLKMSNESIWKIHKVKYVLRLKQNLISVGQLDDKG